MNFECEEIVKLMNLTNNEMRQQNVLIFIINLDKFASDEEYLNDILIQWN